MATDLTAIVATASQPFSLKLGVAGEKARADKAAAYAALAAALPALAGTEAQVAAAASARPEVVARIGRAHGVDLAVAAARGLTDAGAWLEGRRGGLHAGFWSAWLGADGAGAAPALAAFVARGLRDEAVESPEALAATSGPLSTRAGLVRAITVALEDGLSWYALSLGDVAGDLAPLVAAMLLDYLSREAFVIAADTRATLTVVAAEAG